MIHKCSYCGKEWQDEKVLPPSLPPDAVSHGICDDCVPAVNAEIDKMLEDLAKEELDEF